MPKTPRNWPPAALPRRMDREMAAYYCGISPTTFDLRVRAGALPRPHRDGKRLLWDLREIDRALGEVDGEPGLAASSVDDVSAAEAQALAAIQ